MDIWEATDTIDKFVYNDIVIGIDEEDVTEVIKFLILNRGYDIKLIPSEKLWYISVPYESKLNDPEQIFKEFEKDLGYETGIYIKAAALRKEGKKAIIKDGVYYG